MNNDTSLEQSYLPRTERDTSWKGFFTQNEWYFYIFVVLTGIGLRWYLLDLRPVHHDESQHGMFGKYFFDFPDHNFYKYTPMLHGPLLYNLYRLVYNVFGSDNWSIRMPMAALGTLYLLLPFLFRRYFSATAVLFATVAAALGPTMIYWSRFAREDFYTVFGLVSMLYGVLLASPRWKGFFVLFGLTLQFCSKENSYVHVGVFAGFLIFEIAFNFVQARIAERKYADVAAHTGFAFLALAVIGFLVFSLITSASVGMEIVLLKAAGIVALVAALGFQAVWFVWPYSTGREGQPSSMLASGLTNIRSHLIEFAVSLTVCAFIFSFLYSAGFRHMPGILDGLYRESIGYWVAHHNMERIKGPFLFQFYILTWYEFTFIAAFFTHLFYFYWTGGKVLRLLGLALGSLALVAAIPHWFFEVNVERVGLWSFFKLKDSLDVIGLVILLIHPVIVTTHHLIRGQRSLAIWGYLFTSFFFTYSYLGEKVPWLSMYPLMMGIIYLTLYFDYHFRAKPIRWAGAAPWYGLLYVCGAVLLVLGLIFIFEETPKEGENLSIWENSGFLVMGVALVAFGFLDRYFRLFGTYNLKVLALAVITFYNIRAAIMTNFTYTGFASEYISQVHTSPEFHRIALDIRRSIEAAKTGEKPTVLGKGESTWPLTWYMVGVEGYDFDVRAGKKLEDYDYIFDTWKGDEQLKDLPPGFQARRLDFRGWWVPDFNQMTLKKFLRYGLNHTGWSPTGYTYLLFMSKQ